MALGSYINRLDLEPALRFILIAHIKTQPLATPMIQPLPKFRKHRRRAAAMLLLVWIWCLATATFAQGIGMGMGMDSAIPAGPDTVLMTVDRSLDHSVSEAVYRHAGQAGHAGNAAPHQAATTPECCPEDSDVVPLQALPANIAPAALLFLFVLMLLSLRPVIAGFLARRLIPLPSIRRHALHCTYLN